MPGDKPKFPTNLQFKMQFCNCKLENDHFNGISYQLKGAVYRACETPWGKMLTSNGIDQVVKNN